MSIAWLAIAPEAAFRSRMAARHDLTLARVQMDENHTFRAIVTDEAGAPMRLAFDHEAILADAVRRLRARIEYGPVGFAFLPKRFTLRDVQEVHEVVLGRSLAKPAFRRKLLDHHPLRATGEHETGHAFRPAEFYELDGDSQS
ncbi:8-oxo-dGTP diphosphatase [Paracoccus isoporae]|uniref:8-oxo-dGTP diphosphatase n=1 Tax=Paracoccus isoporae TaxID=591205 RepID=A0A1G6X378_9RHOB|nr:8-oxo-dGTP diphosphatase [Paracoccus isoporae]